MQELHYLRHRSSSFQPVPLVYGGGVGGPGGLLPSLADRLRAQSLLVYGADRDNGMQPLSLHQPHLREYLLQRVLSDLQPAVNVHNVLLRRHIALVGAQQRQGPSLNAGDALILTPHVEVQLPLLDQFRRESAAALQEQAAHIAEVILARCLVDAVDAVIRSGRSSVDILGAL